MGNTCPGFAAMQPGTNQHECSLELHERSLLNALLHTVSYSWLAGSIRLFAHVW